MKVQLLPSSSENGVASQKQRLTTFVLDDRVALDAGSLPFACSDSQRKSIRDIILSHTHLDHIAGLPIFIDDLFATLDAPIRVHGIKHAIEVLEGNIFNWDVYPKFSEIKNDFGSVLEYCEFKFNTPFVIGSLTFEAIEVDHHGPSSGFVVDDGNSTVAFTGDTSETREFWNVINDRSGVVAVFAECSFPNRLQGLAEASHHLTPSVLQREIGKLNSDAPRILVTNIKASYRDEVIAELADIGDKRIEVMEIGRTYEF